MWALHALVCALAYGWVELVANGCAVRAAQSCLNNNPSTLHIYSFVFRYLVLHERVYLSWCFSL